MKANEFVKKFGLDESRNAISLCEGYHVVYGFSTKDLKRLVESHELIEKMGGTIDEIKEHVRVVERNIERGVYFKCTIDRNKSRIAKIKQAILDFESCQ